MHAQPRQHLHAAHPPRAARAQAERVELLLQSHSELAAHVEPGSVRLVAFNLGYLPGEWNLWNL